MSENAYKCWFPGADEDANLVSATGVADAASRFARDNDVDCADGNSCRVFVEYGGDTWLFRVTTRVSVEYEAQSMGKRNVARKEGGGDE